MQIQRPPVDSHAKNSLIISDLAAHRSVDRQVHQEAQGVDKTSQNQVVTAQEVEGHLWPMGDKGEVQWTLAVGVCSGCRCRCVFRL